MDTDSSNPHNDHRNIANDMKQLSLKEINSILQTYDRPNPVSNQTGPIRFFDKEMRCGSRGCSSPTYIKVKGMPKCMMHTIRMANEMLVELGVDA